jgi:hypothetical protein
MENILDCPDQNKLCSIEFPMFLPNLDIDILICVCLCVNNNNNTQREIEKNAWLVNQSCIVFLLFTVKALYCIT